ncbi:Beta-glucosidase 24 [Linum grandiflorum]
MKEMGLDAFRFSISWSRILPNGKVDGGVNEVGVAYYNNLINELLANGIEPYVTLFHWDLPQSLEDEYGGFLSSKVASDFGNYADVCFKRFGDRVKYWITLNEPLATSHYGYTNGEFAPGHCSKLINSACEQGDSRTEAYLATHNQLLAHAMAVKVYKQKYQAEQKGIIGITLVSSWFIPYSKSKQDIAARRRALDFSLGWFLHPLTYGDYPMSMRTLVGDRLPKFSKEETELITGSYDFLGLNYYTANYAADSPPNYNPLNATYQTDSLAKLLTERNGHDIGRKSGSSWLYVYPKGIQQLVQYAQKKYKNPVIYITENGISETNNEELGLDHALADETRINFYHRHLVYLKKAIEGGANVKGYFAWSLLDNFEWNSGYSVRFGLVYVDYKNGLTRYPKHSARWFRSFLKKH